MTRLVSCSSLVLVVLGLVAITAGPLAGSTQGEELPQRPTIAERLSQFGRALTGDEEEETSSHKVAPGPQRQGLQRQGSQSQGPQSQGSPSPETYAAQSQHRSAGQYRSAGPSRNAEQRPIRPLPQQYPAPQQYVASAPVKEVPQPKSAGATPSRLDLFATFGSPSNSSKSSLPTLSAAAARVASRPSSPLPQSPRSAEKDVADLDMADLLTPPQQRAGSALSKPRPAGNQNPPVDQKPMDLGQLLSQSVPPRPDASPAQKVTPQEPSSKPSTHVSMLDRRRGSYSRLELAQDLIRSNTPSHDTSGTPPGTSPDPTEPSPQPTSQLTARQPAASAPAPLSDDQMATSHPLHEPVHEQTPGSIVPPSVAASSPPLATQEESTSPEEPATTAENSATAQQVFANEYQPTAAKTAPPLPSGWTSQTSPPTQTQNSNQNQNQNSDPTSNAPTSDAQWPATPAISSLRSTEEDAFGRGSPGNVLVAERLPLIASQVTGPNTILIGREAKYRVTMQNHGDATAQQLTSEIRLPAWAQVVHTVASAGSVQRVAQAGGESLLQWDMPHLGAKQQQTLEVVLIPQTSQPLSLDVRWRHAPVASTTVVEVQEPKLDMTLSGPAEVFFGRPQAYRLTITNPGTGVAEKLLVELMAPGSGKAVSSYRLDALAPGATEVVDVEIIAREAGQLAVSAVATAEGDLRSEASQQIFCRKAELEVDWRGPSRKYAGTEATYYFRVRNPGTAAAEQIVLEANLPAGFEFTGASEGYRHDSASRLVQWKIGALRPGDDYYLELRGVLNQAGQNSLKIEATDGSSINHAAKVAQTDVVALADLKLSVADPRGPIPVGSEAVYEIIVTNRGRSTAKAVNIVGLFSAGIEPLAVEGTQAQIADGRVGFQTIDSLAAGKEVRLKITARADLPGNHLFRAEVACQDLEIKLAAEETTRFFQDDTIHPSARESVETAAQASRFQR